MLNGAAVAIEESDDDGGCDCQLLEVRDETLVSEPTLVLGLLVLWASMWLLLVMVVVVLAQMLVVVVVLLAQMLVVMVEGLGTSGGDIAAPGDLYLLRFYAKVILPRYLLITSCFAMYELTARYPSVLLVMDVLVLLLLLSHPG